jgi:hypothetical protein
MSLEIGKTYKFKEDIDRKEFSFGYTQGRFIGYNTDQWPRFALGECIVCVMNVADENFVEVV